MEENKPLAGVYKWVGFVTFWTVLILGLVELVRLHNLALAFIEAGLK